MIMMIRKSFATLVSLLSVTLLMFSCDQKEYVYSNNEYIMFSDTLNVFPVTNESGVTFDIDVASTLACDYDRTFGVYVVDKGSNAIENVHYKLKSNNVTIKAGETAAKVEIEGFYDNIEVGDSIGFNLGIIIPDNVEWDLYKTTTSVLLAKSCPFNIEDWTSTEGGVNEDGEPFGNFILYCTFPFGTDDITKRLIEGYKIDDNRIRFKDMLVLNHDIIMTFNDDNLLVPSIKVLSQSAFPEFNNGMVTLATHPAKMSIYSNCDKFMACSLLANVEGYGSFGSYDYIFEWIDEDAANEIRKNGF